jgi:hypothetical protein
VCAVSAGLIDQKRRTGIEWVGSLNESNSGPSSSSALTRTSAELFFMGERKKPRMGRGLRERCARWTAAGETGYGRPGPRFHVAQRIELIASHEGTVMPEVKSKITPISMSSKSR